MLLWLADLFSLHFSFSQDFFYRAVERNSYMFDLCQDFDKGYVIFQYTVCLCLNDLEQKVYHIYLDIQVGFMALLSTAIKWYCLAQW